MTTEDRQVCETCRWFAQDFRATAHGYLNTGNCMYYPPTVGADNLTRTPIVMVDAFCSKWTPRRE